MRSRRGQTLVATVIVVAIMALLAVVLMRGSGAFSSDAKSPRADGKGTTVPGLVKYAAKDEVCKSNLSQVRQAIILNATMNEDQPPQVLNELRLPSEFYTCPVGDEPYAYDPTAGLVRCPHPGHERY
jgi:hypothetical protein